MKMEEYAYIIDIPPQTRGNRIENICYAVGDKDFKLFELIYKNGVTVQFEERVYIGKSPELRTKIDHVKRRVGYDDLTGAAQAELEFAIMEAIKSDEARFINFFNTSTSVSLKKHMLEELPGLGKKSMKTILEERDKQKFTSFEDIATRVPSVKNPEKLILARIMLEINDNSLKRYLFVEK